jgi:hypothetical protein
MLQLKLQMKFFGHGFQHIDRDGHGFRANTVAGQNNNFHGISSKIEGGKIVMRRIARTFNGLNWL